MERKVMSQVILMSLALKQMSTGEMRTDTDGQRFGGVMNRNMENELIRTTLMGEEDGYSMVPELMIADIQGQTYLIDGFQRMTTFYKFRYAKCKITKSMKYTTVHYTESVLDNNGKIMRDENNRNVVSVIEYDLVGKTYDDLPRALKDRFDNYQLRFQLFIGCNMKEATDLVRIYNNHVAMNIAQRAFTNLSNYAGVVRNIMQNGFFDNCGAYKDSEKIKGVFERVIVDSVTMMFYPDSYTKRVDSMFNWLNEHAKRSDFETFNSYCERLNPYTDKDECPDVAKLFTSKNSFIWFSVFHKFSKYGIEDFHFGNFMNEFVSSLQYKEMNGISWADLDENNSTKDKKIIREKIEYLCSLMIDYLHIEEIEDTKESTIEQEETVFEFVKNNVDSEVEEEDISLYEQIFDDISLNVNQKCRVLDCENHKSMIGIIAYSFKNDIDLDNWFVDYCMRTESFDYNQKENLKIMISDLNNYISHVAA